MVGRLARWLRLLGFDTFYSNRAEDDYLKELCDREKRILLTRDRYLHIRLRHDLVHLVQSQVPREQVMEVSLRFGLPAFALPPRCACCNGKLVGLDRTETAGRVPLYVFRTQTDFSRCLDCGRFYWPGTHLHGIHDFLKNSFGSVADTGKR